MNLCVDLRFKLSISMLYVQKHAGGEIRGGERELLLEIQLLRRIQAFDRLLVRVQQRRARQLQTLQPVRRDAEDQESPIKKSARYSWAWQVLENPFTNLNYRSFYVDISRENPTTLVTPALAAATSVTTTTAALPTSEGRMNTRECGNIDSEQSRPVGDVWWWSWKPILLYPIIGVQQPYYLCPAELFILKI